MTHSLPEFRLDRPVVLVGLMGAGKTTVGRRLARRLELAFKDADAEIESAAGRTVAEIFEDFGEAGFRDGERRVIARLLSDGGPMVLALGGGAFVDADTRALAKDRAVTVWLKADLDTLMERVSRRDDRPLLRADDPRAVMADLMERRAPFYAEADITVDVDDASHDATASRIVEALEGHLSGAER